MPRIVYVNGRYVPYRQAAVHIEDRGLQFADSVYEVCPVRGGLIVEERRHLDRLERSLGETAIAPPVDRGALQVIMREVLRRERIRDGQLYLQVTRGVAPRNHAFPVPEVRPGLIVIARHADLTALERRAAKGVTVVTTPESRWARVDIKSTSLLPNVLARQVAAERGADEAWFVDADGMVTEGTSSNAWIVVENGTIVTRQADQAILHGVTRAVAKLAGAEHGLSLEERPFSLEEAMGAREAFLTSSSNAIMPVTAIDGHAIGGGKVGRVAKSLRAWLDGVSEYE